MGDKRKMSKKPIEFEVAKGTKELLLCIAELKKKNAELEKKLTEKITLESLDIVSGKITQLEKENAELKEELTKKAETNHSLVEQMADLESENAELKAELSENKVADCHIVNGLCEQLTKAKYILKYVLNSFVGDLPRNLGYFDEEELKAMAEAEQFLSEVEK